MHGRTYVVIANNVPTVCEPKRDGGRGISIGGVGQMALGARDELPYLGIESRRSRHGDGGRQVAKEARRQQLA